MSEGQGRLSVGVDAILSNTTMPLNKTKVRRGWLVLQHLGGAARAARRAGAALPVLPGCCAGWLLQERRSSQAAGCSRTQQDAAAGRAAGGPGDSGGVCARHTSTVLPSPAAPAPQIICTLGPACRE